MGISRILLVFMRAAMAVQVIVGIGFWTGHWVNLVNVHMAIGSLFVIALWVIAGIASAHGRPGRPHRACARGFHCRIRTT